LPSHKIRVRRRAPKAGALRADPGGAGNSYKVKQKVAALVVVLLAAQDLGEHRVRGLPLPEGVDPDGGVTVPLAVQELGIPPEPGDEVRDNFGVPGGSGRIFSRLSILRRAHRVHCWDLGLVDRVLAVMSLASSLRILSLVPCTSLV
jgi:hypothetical protein